MRYPYDQKEKSRQEILAAAERVFKRKGYRGSGIDAIMAEAGMTAGAFYKHFDSKESLLREVLPSALERHVDIREQGLDSLTGADWVRALAHRYLSEQHLVNRATGCPLPSLLSEVGLIADQTRDEFADGIDRWSQQITRQLDALPDEARAETALGVISTMVGGMTLARAVDHELAVRILAAARQVIDDSLLAAAQPVDDQDGAEALSE